MSHRRPAEHRARPGAGRPAAAAALAVLLAAAALCVAGAGAAGAQTESLRNRISNERLTQFEEKLTERINRAMQRYIHQSRYVLSVKVIWDPEIVPVVEDPELTPDRAKLPGFPIFVRSPQSAGDGETRGTPPFERLEVKVLLDETLPEYYERFVRKLVPIVARFDFNRGDQVVVLKETFPVLPQEEQPPTLPEQELMEKLGQQPLPGRQPPQRPVQPPPVYGAAPGYAAPAQPPPAAAPGREPAPSPAQAAQNAFDERRYQDALRVVQAGFQRATTNSERSFYLGMEGSIHYAMGDREAARAAWERAVSFDPSNMEVHRALNYLETRQQRQQGQAPQQAPQPAQSRQQGQPRRQAQPRQAVPQ